MNHISLDCVIFGFHENEMKVLVLELKQSGDYILPGGFLGKNETLEVAAERVLKERTGLRDIFLRQFHTFSQVDRSKNNPGVKYLLDSGAIKDDSFFAQRFISVGFYALVEYTKVRPMPDHTSERCTWINLDEISRLVLDHTGIVEKAHQVLKTQLNHQPIGHRLLPAKFTMPELQTLYETLLGKKLDRRNFQRKMLSYDILVRLNERRMGGAHKSPYLYMFSLETYNRMLENGLKGNF